MDEMKLTQVAMSELKQENVSDFNIISENNKIALHGSTGELALMELTYLTGTNSTMPYTLSYLEVPQDRPCKSLLANSELLHIYEACSVQESQELALDPMYVAEYSLEPTKAKMLQLSWAPWKLDNGQPILAILTTYGTCQIMSKEFSSRYWLQNLCSLERHLIHTVFPVNKTINGIKSFREFKEFIDLYWITAFCWNASNEKHIIFAANAAGYVIAFEFEESEGEHNEQEGKLKVKEYCRTQTSLGRISYAKSYDDFLLLGNIDGAVHLFRVEHGTSPAITKVECLWSKADRMAIRKAEVSYEEKTNSYFVVFPKAAHFLAYHLTQEGSLVSSSTLYVGGLKITGLKKLFGHEFIITTITGVIHHIRLNKVGDEEMRIDDEIVPSDINGADFQILGIAATRHRILWSFILFRTKEYCHQAKYTASTAFLSMARLSRCDGLVKLANSNIAVMDTYVDYAIDIRLSILNNLDHERYNAFCTLKNAKFPNELNDAFMQKLQIKLLIVKNIIEFESTTFKLVKKSTKSELDFLLRSLQVVHILCRLQYLARMKESMFSSFQLRAIKCMKERFALLMSELRDLISEDNSLRSTVERFTKLASDEMSTKHVRSVQVCNEKCLDCGDVVDSATMMCSKMHRVRRCCVSFVQVPLLINQPFCVNCDCVVTEDLNDLQQLFAPGETAKCTYCRFSFTVDLN